MNKYRVTFNNPMYDQTWLVEDKDLYATIQNHMSGAGYVSIKATDWTSKEICQLLFNPGNFSSVEIKEVEADD